MDAYARALHNVALAGPTLFGPVINTAAQIAGQSISYNSSKYFVLLIITVKRMLNQIYFVCDKLLFLLKQMRYFMYTGFIHKALLKRILSLFDASLN